MSQSKEPAPFWFYPGIVMLLSVAVLIVVVLMTDNEDSEDTVAQGNETPQSVGNIDPNDLTTVERHDPNDPLALGDENAPVTMVAFSDYQCPFCAAWSEDTLPVLVEEYVESGDLRIEWRDVNMYGEASERGARAVYAAALQDRFLDYHAVLFPDGETRSEDDLSEAALIGIAQDLDLDIDQFTEDFNSRTVQDAVAENQQLAIDLSTFSTPAFIIAGEPMTGALPTDFFQELLDGKLAK